MCKLDGARKKYHSGTKCLGVSIGSAGIQLSGWFKRLGKKKTNTPKNIKKEVNANKSLEK